MTEADHGIEAGRNQVSSFGRSGFENGRGELGLKCERTLIHRP